MIIPCKYCQKPCERVRPEVNPHKNGTVCHLCTNRIYKMKNTKRPLLDTSIPHYLAPKVHKVKCLGCGVEIERKSYWRTPSCADCSRKRGRKGEYARIMDLRKQARRYRIVLRLMGYEDSQFEQMIEDIKESDFCIEKRFKGWHARHDWTLEKRARARAAKNVAE